MSEFSKFDTQIHIEETNEYQPTAADLAEYAAWLDEVEGDDGHVELYTDVEFELSAPEWYEEEEEDSLGEMSTLDGIEVDYEPEDSFYDYADLMGEFYG